jgi:hypothetical protein
MLILYVFPRINLTISCIEAQKNQSFIALSTETEGAASYGAAPSVVYKQENTRMS